MSECNTCNGHGAVCCGQHNNDACQGACRLPCPDCKVSQEVINSLWVKFDHDNPNTWPELDQAANDSEYLVMVNCKSYGDHTILRFDSFDMQYGQWLGAISGGVFKVVAYTNPENFKSTEIF